MNFTNEDRSRGRDEMEKTINRAARVRRAVSAGRPPKHDTDLQALQGVRVAVSLLKEFREAMQRAGLSPKHAIAKLIFDNPKTGADIVDITPRAIEQEARLADFRTRALAVLFGQYDAEKSLKFFWTRNFVTTPEARTIVNGFVTAEKEAAKAS